MRRRLAVLLASLGLLLGGLITASVPMAEAAPIPPGAGPPGAPHIIAPAGTVTSAYYIHDATGGGGPDAWMNDSSYGCANGTPVIGWTQETGGSNERVYFISLGNGDWTLHFQSCGNNVCIWQYGFSGYDNLYMHTCNGGANNDLYYLSSLGGGYNAYCNQGDNACVTGHVNNQQLTSQTFAGDWSSWIGLTA